MVPGVTRRTTSRRTTDFAPRFLASAGSSICSQTATRKPERDQASADSRRRHATGTPHIGMSSPRCLPRLVSAMPSAARGDLGIVEEQLVEIAHAVEQQAVRIGRLDLEVLLHHRRDARQASAAFGADARSSSGRRASSRQHRPSGRARACSIVGLCRRADPTRGRLRRAGSASRGERGIDAHRATLADRTPGHTRSLGRCASGRM